MKRHHLTTVAAVGGLALLVAAPATVHADRPAPAACGAVVTHDVRLTGDLTCDGAGLVVGADGIRIDLAGHTLAGSGSGIGIDNNGGFDRITIRNGTVAGFQFGTDQLETSGSRIEKVLFSGNGIGISLGRTIGFEVDRVTVEGNAFDGMTVGFTEGTTIRRSVFARNGVSGVNELASQDTRYERNTAVANVLDGITTSLSTGVTIERTEASGNGGDGIELGFWTEQATLTANRANGNGEFGIIAVEGTVDGGRNRAAGNAGGDCIAIACR